AIRPSRGPARTTPGKYVRRMPISVIDGSCFQMSTRLPARPGGMGTGAGIGVGAAGGPGWTVAFNTLRCRRYPSVGTGTNDTGRVPVLPFVSVSVAMVISFWATLSSRTDHGHSA